MSFLLIKIGQNDENDVVLIDPSIAPEHAEIFVDVEGNVFLTDLGTGKDTFVNGHKIVDSIELKSIDQLTFGNGIALDWKKVLEINQPKTITVGRAKTNDFIMDAPSVSENHLQLIQDQNDSYFINDLESEQGTYVNGNRISEIALLKAGDVVHVGDELLLWKSVFSNSEALSEGEEKLDVIANADLEKENLIEEISEAPLEQLEMSFEPLIEFVSEEDDQEELENQEVVEDHVEIQDEKELPIDFQVETPELKEPLNINPEPIDFVIEPDVSILEAEKLEVEKSEPVFEKPAFEEPIVETKSFEKPSFEKPIQEKSNVAEPLDSSALQLDQANAISRKKELIQLAFIVVADILLIILISALI
ncbi:MAG: FHA domain-containing protein [Crocinitomicaceae bacterium]|nr:FHA domain-containing protein [Crocinitomicaceae bacterium]